MLPHVIRYNVLGNLEKFSQLAAPFGIPQNGHDSIQMVEKVINAIDRLSEDLHVPRHLKDFGVREKDIPMLAEGALKSTRPLVNHPRNLTLDDAKSIFRAAM